MIGRVELTAQQGAFTLRARGDLAAGITSVFGPSGCGKSTLLRAVAGLIAAQGRLNLGSEDLARLPAHRRGTGMVFQDARLFAHLSVAGNLRYAQRRARARVDRDAIIDQTGIGALLPRRARTLSGGERQRVALARALLSAPRLLLLDEPLSALDAAGRTQMMTALDTLRAGAVPVLHVSHDISEVARLADQIWLMRDGEITRHGPAQEVMNDPQSAAALGPRQAGALVHGEVLAYHPLDDLTEITLGGGRAFVPGRIGAPGGQARLRIPAHDVTLHLNAPQGCSALSHLAVTITEIAPSPDRGALIGLRSGQVQLLAQITRRSVQAMALAPGMRIYASFKATALAQTDTGP